MLVRASRRVEEESLQADALDAGELPVLLGMPLAPTIPPPGIPLLGMMPPSPTPRFAPTHRFIISPETLPNRGFDDDHACLQENMLAKQIISRTNFTLKPTEFYELLLSNRSYKALETSSSLTRTKSHHEDPQGKSGVPGINLAGKALSNFRGASIDNNNDYSGGKEALAVATL
ncbi:MAG: hypothetical protein Q9173_002563 [Seirophora scorigena]